MARGADIPLNGIATAPADAVHGKNGLGDIPLPPIDDTGLDPRPASQFIIDTVRANPGEVTIIAVGRMTNLALALRQDPAIAGLVKQVVIMGGAFGYNGHGGNVTPAAEANIHGDPLAADEIFAAPWKVVVIGLDVTQEVLMSTAYMAELRDRAGANGQLLWDMTRLYEDFYGDITGVEGVFGHDSLAVAYAIAPELFTVRAGPIRVLTEGIAVGQTIQQPAARKFGHGDWSGRPAQYVAIATDAQGVLDLYMNVVTGASPA